MVNAAEDVVHSEDEVSQCDLSTTGFGFDDVARCRRRQAMCEFSTIDAFESQQNIRKRRVETIDRHQSASQSSLTVNAHALNMRVTEETDDRFGNHVNVVSKPQIEPQTHVVAEGRYFPQYVIRVLAGFLDLEIAWPHLVRIGKRR